MMAQVLCELSLVWCETSLGGSLLGERGYIISHVRDSIYPGHGNSSVVSEARLEKSPANLSSPVRFPLYGRVTSPPFR